MNRDSILAFGLAALVTVCSTILVVTGHTVPDQLWGLGWVAVGGGAGVAVTRGKNATP